MRERKGLTNKELAKIVGMMPYRITRWEKSDDLPPDELLPTLFDTLDAQPEEREFLSRRSRLLPPLESLARGHRHGLDLYAERLDALEAMSAAYVEMPGDLTFLALEAELVPLAQAGRQDAGLLLSRALVAHAEWLERKSRFQRLPEYADAVLEAMPRLGRTADRVPASEVWWARAVVMRADSFVRLDIKHLPPKQAIPLRYGWAVDYLKDQESRFAHPRHRLRVHQVIASNLTMLGEESSKEALPWLQALFMRRNGTRNASTGTPILCVLC